MTIIKLNCNVEMPKVCDECPFLKSYLHTTYGESDGYDELYCGLTRSYIGESDPYEDEEYEKLSNCPLISIESH